MTTTTETTTTARSDGAVKIVGIITLVAGVIMILAGAATWLQVTNELKDQRITVAEDASMYAGKQVAGPLTAYAEAEVIQKHALEATGGKTYAELDREDPVREVAMTASFLRASLFSSVIAFGVAAMAIGLGVVNILLGCTALFAACIVIALQGITLMHFWWALLLLGVGWNFLYIGGTTLLTAVYRPEEKNKVQGAMDTCVYSTMAVTSFSSGALVTTQGWQLLNLGSLVPIAAVSLALLWLALLQRRPGGLRAAP